MAQQQFHGATRRAILGGAAAVLVPGSSRAQAPSRAGMRRLGVLLPFRMDDRSGQRRAAALLEGLASHAWHEGGNLGIDWRWAGGDPALFERYAAELVTLAPDVLVAVGSPSVLALRRLTGKIPIVFTVVTDPVGQHLVESLTRPGGNITGFSDYDPPMAGKWIEMLTQIAPPVLKATVIYNSAAASFAELMRQPIEDAARTFSVAVRSVSVNDDSEIEATMSALARENGNGVIVLPDFFTFVHRETIVASANRYRLPAIYWHRDFVSGGGLMSYGVDNADLVRRSADYVDRILRGARPADLPVQNPIQFELAINLKTAKQLGVTIRPTLMAIADEVIE
ncbi:MAG: ABC transporter substrate-binding protein [Reyranellales bacterium]